MSSHQRKRGVSPVPHFSQSERIVVDFKNHTPSQVSDKYSALKNTSKVRLEKIPPPDYLEKKDRPIGSKDPPKVKAALRSAYSSGSSESLREDLHVVNGSNFSWSPKKPSQIKSREPLDNASQQTLGQRPSANA